LEEAREEILLLGEHQLNAVAFFWGAEACRTVVSDDWKLNFVREILKETLPAVDKGADYSQVTLVDGII
jgi:hypothetical protein